MLLYLLFAVVMMVMGVMMLVSPAKFYNLTEAKEHSESHEGHDESKPSVLFVICARLGGFVLVLVGIACIFLCFL